MIAKMALLGQCVLPAFPLEPQDTVFLRVYVALFSFVLRGRSSGNMEIFSPGGTLRPVQNFCLCWTKSGSGMYRWFAGLYIFQVGFFLSSEIGFV